MYNVSPTQPFVTELFDFQPDSVIWYQPVFADSDELDIVDFVMAYCNKQAEKILGVDRSQIIGASIIKTPYLDGNTAATIMEQCKNVWFNDQWLEFTYYNDHFDRYFDVRRIKVANGILSINRDRTDMVLMEMEKEKQSNLLSKLIDHSPYGVCLYKSVRNSFNEIVDFKLQLCNQKGARTNGSGMDEAYKTSFLQMLQKKNMVGEIDLYKKVVEENEPSYREVYNPVEKCWWGMSATKFEDGFLLNYLYVTQQVEVKKLADNLQTIVDATQTGICLLAPVYNSHNQLTDLVIKKVNKTVSKYVGVPTKMMYNTTVSKWLPEFKDHPIFNLFCDTLQNGTQNRSTFEHSFNNVNAWFDVMTTRVDENVLVTFHDYSEVKNLQLQYENLVHDLKQSNTNLEEFAYAASHDLQEPLRKINYFSERLRKRIADSLSEEEEFMFVRMESAARRMKTLINDLLSYSRVSTKPLERTSVSLNDIVQLTLADLEASVNLKKAIINIEQLPTVKGDSVQLRQLFLNLFSNALKYNKVDSSPIIVLQATCDTRTINGHEIHFHVISITDEGIGFEQQYAKHIFKVFQRLHGLSEYPGTGVGLAIAQKVIENHNGFIEAEGAPQKGATFRVWLPYKC